MPTKRIVCPRCKRGMIVSTDSPVASCANCGMKIAVGQPAAPGDPFAELEDVSGGVGEMEPDDEPWFYGFLAGYAFLLMFVSIIIMTFGVLLVGVGASAQNVPPAQIFGAVLILIVMFIGVLVTVAFILLAVDIGRNLRAINRNTRRR
jgi:hypothetical protein